MEPDKKQDKGWIGVDLDGTLAEYHGFKKDGSIGAPVYPMVKRVRRWIKEGKNVKIFTARINPNGREDYPENFDKQVKLIEQWCLENLYKVLPVTYEKDIFMIELWDDRAVQVVKNTGERVDGKND